MSIEDHWPVQPGDPGYGGWQKRPEDVQQKSFAVRGVGAQGLDLVCRTCMAPGPDKALSHVLNFPATPADDVRCWVVTRL